MGLGNPSMPHIRKIVPKKPPTIPGAGAGSRAVQGAQASSGRLNLDALGFAPPKKSKADKRNVVVGADKKQAPKPAQAPADYGLAGNVTDPMYQIDPSLLGPSARAGVTADPKAMAAQQRAMDELFGIYNQGGATAQDRAREAQARANTDQYLRSQREAQQQDLQERGMGGSGAEIGMLLGDRQDAGTRLAASDLDTQAMHEKRAMDALMGGAGIAGSVRGSSFSEGQTRATAADEFTAMNNKMINDAQASNADWLRDSKAKLENNKFISYEHGLDRGTTAANSLMGYDAAQDRAGWDSGNATAASDAAAKTAAQNTANNDALSFVNPVANNAVDTGTSASVTGANTAGTNAGGQVITGANQTAGAVGDAVSSGAAGGASGDALEFDPITGKRK